MKSGNHHAAHTAAVISLVQRFLKPSDAPCFDSVDTNHLLTCIGSYMKIQNIDMTENLWAWEKSLSWKNKSLSQLAKTCLVLPL